MTWPAFNALLNLLCASLLVLGWREIRAGRMARHRAFMISAFIVSAGFLVSYLLYHAYSGSRAFGGQGWIRPLYFTILISHSLLAAAVVPLVVVTLVRGLKGHFLPHRKVARWTFPIWLYVSATGVIVYLLLYQL